LGVADVLYILLPLGTLAIRNTAAELILKMFNLVGYGVRSVKNIKVKRIVAKILFSEGA